MGCVNLVTAIILCISLATCPSPPVRSHAHTKKPHAEGGEGLALDKISTDQSDLTEVISFMTLVVCGFLEV